MAERSFTEYYDGFGFFPDLTMTTREMYAVKLLEGPAALTLSGAPVALPFTVELFTGWTFLPNPYRQPVVVSAGMPAYGYGNGAQVKSQAAFAEYYDEYGWYVISQCTARLHHAQSLPKLHAD